MSQFKGLVAHNVGNALGIKYDDKFYITYLNGRFKLHAEPEFRQNGTQTHDGYFPRYFDHPRYAKTTLTKFLGISLTWKDLEK